MKHRLLPAHFTALVLILLVVQASGSEAPPDAGKRQRVAVLSTADVQKSGLADLLVARLAKQDGIELIERDRIAELTAEWKLGSLLGAGDSAKRLKLGQLAGADILVIAATVPAAADSNSTSVPIVKSSNPGKSVPSSVQELQIVVCESRFGTRLAAQLSAWPESDLANRAEELAATVSHAAGRLHAGLKLVVGTSPFISRNFRQTHDHLRQSLRHVLEGLLLNQPGVALVEIEEAHQLAQELARTDSSTQTLPRVFYVEGEFKCTDDATNEVEIEVSLALRAPGKLVEQITLPPLVEEKLAAELTGPVARKLLERCSAEPVELPDRAAQAKELNARAKLFLRLRDHRTAWGLREAALLLDPDDVETRLSAIALAGSDMSYQMGEPRPDSPGFAIFRDELVPRLWASWHIRRRHAEFLFQKRLVNLREASHLNGMAIHALQRIRELYPPRFDSSQPKSVAPAEPELVEIAEEVADFQRFVVRSVPQLDATIADGVLRTGDEGPAAEKWSAAQQWEHLQTSLLHSHFTLGERVTLDRGLRSPTYYVDDDTLAAVTEVLQLCQRPENPPNPRLIRLVLPHSQLAGTRYVDDFINLWGDDTWIEGRKTLNPSGLTGYITPSRAQLATFAAALAASKQPANAFAADCLVAMVTMYDTPLYEHDRALAPEVERLIKLAIERKYPDDAVHRLREFATTVEKLAVLAEGARERAARPKPPPKPYKPAATVFNFTLRDSWEGWRRDPNPRVRFTPVPEFKHQNWLGLQATDHGDLAWNDREVWFLPQPGKSESLLRMAEKAIAQVHWDGSWLWVVTREDGVYVFSGKGEQPQCVPYDAALPQPSFRRGPPLGVLKPGCAVVAANHGRNSHFYIATIEQNAAGKFAAKIRHSVTDFDQPPADVDPTLYRKHAAHWVVGHRGEKDSGSLALVGVAELNEKPLAFDLNTGKLRWFPEKLQVWNRNLRAELHYFDTPLSTAGPYRHEVKGPPLDSKTSEAVRMFLPKQFSPLQLQEFALREGKYLYLPSYAWARYDLENHRWEPLCRALLPGHYNFSRYALSRHYGLVAWHATLPHNSVTVGIDFTRRHEGVVFQVRIDEPADVSAELEHVPMEHREKHSAALAHVRKFGGDVGINDVTADLGAEVVLPKEWRGTAGDLAPIGDLYRLHRLVLHGQRFTNASLAEIAYWQSLEELELHDTAIDEDGVDNIVKLSGLQRLAVRSENSNLSAAGLMKLAELRFASLTLAGAGIDDAAAEQLLQFPRLPCLELEHHSISPRLLARLREKHGMPNNDERSFRQ